MSRKGLLLCREWMVVRAKIKTWWMQSHPLSFLPSQILHLSSFCLCVHSYIPLPPHLPVDSHSPTLSVIASFSFSLPLGFLPTHSIFPLSDPSSHVFIWGEKNSRGRGAENRRWAREGGSREEMEQEGCSALCFLPVLHHGPLKVLWKSGLLKSVPFSQTAALGNGFVKDNARAHFLSLVSLETIIKNRMIPKSGGKPPEWQTFDCMELGTASDQGARTGGGLGGCWGSTGGREL